MTPPARETIFDRFLAPVFNNFLLDHDEIRALRNRIDWDEAIARLTNPQTVYPSYYSQTAFHGITKGYLCPEAAITYDPITQYALLPNEGWVRQGLIDAIQSCPRRILDLGCGTGSMTRLLKQTFPGAEVTGLDLSPYMLAVAESKAQDENLEIRWCQAQAEHTGFPEASFDVVTASLLLHETPPAIAQAILREAHRLLTVGGELVLLDGNQKALRQTPILTEIFEEPYLQDYALGNLDAWMGAAGFGAVRSQDHWLVHQITRGVKGLHEAHPEEVLFADLESIEGAQWILG